MKLSEVIRQDTGEVRTAINESKWGFISEVLSDLYDGYPELFWLAHRIKEQKNQTNEVVANDIERLGY